VEPQVAVGNGPDARGEATFESKLDSREACNNCQATLASGVNGLRIGVLKEGFGLELSEPDVDAAVHKALGVFQ